MQPIRPLNLIGNIQYRKCCVQNLREASLFSGGWGHRTVAVLHNSRSCTPKHLPHYPGTNRGLLGCLNLVLRAVLVHCLSSIVANSFKVQRRARPGVHL